MRALFTALARRVKRFHVGEVQRMSNTSCAASVDRSSPSDRQAALIPTCGDGSPDRRLERLPRVHHATANSFTATALSSIYVNSPSTAKLF